MPEKSKSRIRKDNFKQGSNHCDSAYLSFDREATVGKWIIKRKTTPNHPLSKEDEKRNSEIEVIRRHVEKAFGNAKQIFGILRNDYRCRREWLSPIVTFCFGVANLKQNYFLNSDSVPTLWDGPIPRIESFVRPKKRVKFQ
jgi:hypothetical protein